MGGGGKGGRERISHAETNAMAPRLRREVRGEWENLGPGQGAASGAPWRAGALSRTQAFWKTRAPSLWVTKRAPGPRPAPPPLSRTPASGTQETRAGQPCEAKGRPKTHRRSPDAPPTAPRSASGASFSAQRVPESADSRGAGPPGRGGSAGWPACVKAGRDRP